MDATTATAGYSGQENGPDRRIHVEGRPPVCALRGLGKSFGGVFACRSLTIEIFPGEILALIGENGAGKSTAMKCLNGLYRPNEGFVEIDGKQVEFASPRDSEAARIAMIPQELDLFPELSVAENLFVGLERPRASWGGFDWAAKNRRAKALLGQLGLKCDATAPVRSLSPAAAKLVQIARALNREPRIIIMDEPTAALTENEVERLFAVIRRLVASGTAVVYISHRLDELFRVANRIAVLRDGRLVRVDATRDFTTTSLVHAMVGRPLEQLFVRHPHAFGDPVLTVEGLSDGRKFANVSFSLRRGEILGFAGLIGAGRTEVALTLFGVSRATAGTVRIDGHPVAITSVREAIRHRIAYVPEERRSDGLILPFSIGWNMSLPSLSRFGRFGFVSRSREQSYAENMARRFDVRGAAPSAPVGRLSGGNQQKVLLAKMLGTEPEIILLDEPTRGVDIGAKSEIYALIDELAKAGKAVLLISSEMNELLSMCDRVLVLREGRLTGEFAAETLTAANIGAAATGQLELLPRLERSMSADRFLDTTAFGAATTQTARVASWAGIAARPDAPALAFLIILLALNCAITPGFFTWSNLVGILDQVSYLSVVAVWTSFVILAAEIDISLGSLLGVCCFVYGGVSVLSGGSLAPLGAALVTGALLGALNGILATVGRIPSIVATLGTQFLFRGALLIWGGNIAMTLAPDARVLGASNVLGAPVAVLLAAGSIALAALISRHTTWGRDIFAVGGNQRAAETIGIRVQRVRFFAFVLSGTSCGLAAAMFLGQVGLLQATVGSGFELRVIAAVVLGGTSIRGGRGTVLGPVVGAITVGVVLDMLTLNRVSGTYELIVLGALILLAIAVGGLRNRSTRRRD